MAVYFLFFYYFFFVWGVRGKCAFFPLLISKNDEHGLFSPSLHLSTHAPELLPHSVAVAADLLTKVEFLTVLPPANTAGLPPGLQPGVRAFILRPPLGITTAASKTLLQLLCCSHMAGVPHFNSEACRCGCQFLQPSDVVHLIKVVCGTFKVPRGNSSGNQKNLPRLYPSHSKAYAETCCSGISPLRCHKIPGLCWTTSSCVQSKKQLRWCKLWAQPPTNISIYN